uniref:Uncharacterized protein n=1 Tax=Setaria viridis TaxID=4556 RepID=A0A4V6D232_SETVI|nr:hypothetical protein SEVIR_9G468200v2 [Setaria viridis]
MQALDLNSQVDEFPAFTSYADILRGEDGGVARGGGARTVGLRVPRNGGGGSRGGGSTRGGGAGGSKVRGAGRSRGGGTIRGGGSGCSRGGGRATRNLFIGSASDGGAGGGGRAGGRRRRGGSVDEEGFLYADEGNAPDVADGVEVIFPGSSKTESGLGRASNGTVTAPDWWWEKNTKGSKSECKKFKYGVPEYMDQLEEIFHEVVVDGSTSFIPGAEDKEPGEEDEELPGEPGEEDEELPGEQGFPFDCDDSPISTNSRKRVSSTSTRSTATSPGKKSKSPIVQVMDKMLNKWVESDAMHHKILKKKVDEKATKEMKERAELKKCQELALECGAAPDSLEYYACLNIFKDGMHREFLCNIPSPEARLIFLRRWCEEHKMY